MITGVSKNWWCLCFQTLSTTERRESKDSTGRKNGEENAKGRVGITRHNKRAWKTL